MRVMSAAGRRTLSPVLMTLLLGASFLVGVVRAAPAYAATCGGKTGINVVVDFTRLGGKVRVGCDHKRPANGLAALKRAGFTYTFVPRIPGFVCTIDKRPRKCNGAPSRAYWSYWHARPHGRWIYSNLGAGEYHPQPGSVQGWAFGNGKPPKISPP
jgi:hypothetical protein